MATEMQDEGGNNGSPAQMMQNRAGNAYYNQKGVWVDGRINSESKAKTITLNIFDPDTQELLEKSDLLQQVVDLVNVKIKLNEKIILELTDKDTKQTKSDISEIRRALNI
jgi:hypothetical protein